jgi:hypothetical protein
MANVFWQQEIVRVALIDQSRGDSIIPVVRMADSLSDVRKNST